MAWVLVVVAGLLETAFALSLKASDGFSRPGPSVLFLLSGAASFALLALALRSLPVGPAYAVWTGMGAIGTGLAGIALYGEPATALKLGSLALVAAGLVGLQLTSSAH